MPAPPISPPTRSAVTVNAMPYPLTGFAGSRPRRLDCSSFSRLMRASRSLSRSSGACPFTARSLVIPSGAPCTAGSQDDSERVRMLSRAQTEPVSAPQGRPEALEKEPSLRLHPDCGRGMAGQGSSSQVPHVASRTASCLVQRTIITVLESLSSTGTRQFLPRPTA